MKIISIFFVVSLSINSWAQSKAVKSFKAVSHENLGCPINSICSKESGKLISHWEKMTQSIGHKDKIKKLKSYHKKFGLPLYFLTKISSQESLDSVLWNSRCKLHNPRNPQHNIYKAMKFLKKLPTSSEVILTPITLYQNEVKTKYQTPYQDQIILIKNNQLVILRDYDDFYFQLGIKPNGDFEVLNLPSKVISKALERKIVDTKCPDKIIYDDNYFTKSYCQKVLDLDTNTLKTIQFAWTCP